MDFSFLNMWQFNLVGFLVCVVVYFQFYKLAVQHAHKDGAATILLQIIASAAVLVLAPFFPLAFPTDWRVYGMLVLACIFYALNDRLQTTVRKHLQVSVFSIISQLSTVFLILFGVLIFGEPFAVSKLLGAGLILLGNALLFFKRGTFELNKYVWLSMLASLVFAIAISIDIGIAQQFNLPIYIMVTLFVPAVMLVLAEKIKPSEIIAEYTASARKYYLITGAAWALTIFFSLRAFQFGEVTTIVPLQATSVLLNVLVAYVMLGEKKDDMKKLIAAVVVILGVYFTVVR